MTTAVCLFALLLVASVFAARINIDTFGTSSPTLIYDPKGKVQPQSATTDDTNVLSGSRDIYVTAPGGGSQGQAVTTDCEVPALGSPNPTVAARTASSVTPAGFFLSNPTAACSASGYARYDGSNRPAGGCDYYSANCIPAPNFSINFSSATNFIVKAGADLDNTYFAIWLYSGSQAQNFCGALRKINPNTNGPSVFGSEFSIPFNEFKTPTTPPAASGLLASDFAQQNCDLSAITAVEAQMVGGLNWDQTLYYLGYEVPDLITISGAAFDDCNCAGSTSTAKFGVTVQLFAGSSCTGNALQTTSTASNGAYSFSSVSPGTYTVCASASSSTICSNSASSQTRTVSTSTAGINFFYAVQSGVLTCPPNRDVVCGADTSVATGCGGSGCGAATITSGCGGTAAVTQNPDQTQSITCSAPGAIIQTITRSWSAGGQTCSQTINIRDNNVVPVLGNVPANVVIDCNAADPTDLPTVSGSCSNPRVTVVSNGGTNGQCDVNTCSRSTVSSRTFTPVDSCGNTGVSQTQTITRNCQQSCPTCPTCPPPVTVPVTVPVTQAPRPPVGPLNCKFICDDADSSAVASVVSLAVIVILAVFAL